MDVIVCGGRDYSLGPAGLLWLDILAAQLPITRIYHGAATGIDTAVATWAVAHAIPVEAFAAEWDTYGPAAGPQRNTRMLRALQRNNPHQETAVVAFPGHAGTADMVRKARGAHIRIIHAPEETIRMPMMVTNKKSNTGEKEPPPAPVSPEEEAIFGADDISDPTLPLSLQQALTEESPLVAVQEPQDAIERSPRPETQVEAENAPTALLEPTEGHPAPGRVQGVVTETPEAPEAPPSVADLNHYEALLQAFCSVALKRLNTEVLDASKEAVKQASESYDNFYTMAHAIMDTNIRRRLEVGSLVETVAQPITQQGLLVRGDPYTVTIEACAPQGFPVRFTLAKQDSQALFDAVEAFLGWLPEAGFTPPPAAPY